MGTRIISRLGRKPPAIYSEITEQLVSEGILSLDLASKFKKMIGFRNIVVHGYLGIDIKKLEEILAKKKYREIYKIALEIYEFAVKKNLDP
ncbi:MAG: DUF86 domain-containing protein [Candidatus Korarchaeota archaeon]|nr:DUF86 domain-containing protein [Candidatus Korarchaeota archaeon]